MQIVLSSLPANIYNKIPLSIRSHKDEYDVLDLPFDIQDLVSKYVKTNKSIEYDVVFDALPNLSVYGDFNIIDNAHDLVVEYFKNYLTISLLSYPFDPLFGCNLKKHLQTLDTQLRNILINNEISHLAQTVSSDLSIPIQILKTSVNKSTDSTMFGVVYEFSIQLKINNIEKSFKITTST